MTPSNQSDFLAKHTAILGRLDYAQRRGNQIHFYAKEEFEKALPTYENVPIIYSKSHTKTGFRGHTVEEVLKETNGRIVGFSNQALINNMGSPKIQSVLNITDPEMDAKIHKGEISISQGFWYSAPDVGTLRNVCADHILLYDRAGGPPQGDVAAMIVNQSTDSENNDGTAYYGFLEGYLQTAGENMTENPTELETVLQILKTNQDELNGKIFEKETEILKLNQSLEAKDTEILTKSQELEAKEGDILKLNQDLAEKDKKIAELEKSISDEAELKIKNQQDDFWNNLLEGTREKFSDRKTELSDPNKQLKLCQDITDFERSLGKPDLKKAEGTPELKGNQDGDFEAKPTAYDPYKGVMI